MRTISWPQQARVAVTVAWERVRCFLRCRVAKPIVRLRRQAERHNWHRALRKKRPRSNPQEGRRAAALVGLCGFMHAASRISLYAGDSGALRAETLAAAVAALYGSHGLVTAADDSGSEFAATNASPAPPSP